MRSHVLPLAVLVSLGTVSLASAATTSVGVIKSIDTKAHSVTLADGTSYMLPATVKDSSLKTGEKISIAWILKGSARDAEKVTMVK